MYKVDSPDAVDFINHQEIIETLEYARAHRNDRELIRNLIEKARPVSYTHLTLPTTSRV